MKIHLPCTTENPEDWKRSPHIERALRESRFTTCRTIVDLAHITTDHDKVACKACILTITQSTDTKG